MIRISANTLQVDGVIRADGIAGSGAGSGGGIRLDVGIMSGSGTISANGGALAGSTSFASGGGRIAVYYTDKSGFGGSVTANGGYYTTGQYSPKNRGGAGTVYMKSSTQTYGDLIIDNNGYYTYEGSTPLRSINSGTILNLTADTLGDDLANFDLPNTTTGALGLKGLLIDPDPDLVDLTGTIYQPLPQTFEVIDNTLTTLTTKATDGDMTLAAIPNDNYIGITILDNLTVTGQAKVDTGDDIYVVGTLTVSGGTLNANKIYEAGYYQGQTYNTRGKLDH